MIKNNKISSSGEQDAPKTPAGSTSPIHQERIVPQENTTGDLHLTCNEDPLHPGELRCRLVSGPVVPNADSSVSTSSADSLPDKSGEDGSETSASDGVEVWNRNNGEAMRVKRIEWEGRVLFLPIDATQKPQPVDPQSPSVKTAKQDSAVGRSRLSRVGGKGSCTLLGTHHSTRVRQNDQTRDGGS